MLDLKLPQIKFSVPEWRPRDLQFFQEHASCLRSVEKQATGVSNAMKIRAFEIRDAVVSGHSLVQQIQSGKDIRALLMLWLHYNEDSHFFVGKMAPSLSLFDRFETVRPQLSKLALHDLAQVYFDYFDRFPTLDLLCEYLQRQFEQQRFSCTQNQLGRLACNREYVFRSDAPSWVVDYAISHGLTLCDALSGLGIPETEGIFGERCTALYYISALEQLAFGQDSDIFAEILQNKVVNTPYREGLLIGHAVLNILIGKVSRSGKAMPENWMKIILTIADDPRVPSNSRSFQTWWRRLDQSYIDQVRGWLSRFDLDLFLRAFEAFANQSGEEDLRRMFPARKRFLEGLFDHGLISNTRLFIGSHAIQFLKQNYDEKELPIWAELKDRDKSIIYMNVAGYHVIEGSHSAKFWIFDRLPSVARILNYNTTKFGQSELGADIERAYHSEFSERRRASDVPISIIHNPNLTWQHKVIQAFQQLGVELDAERLLTPQDYRAYKQKYGLAYY